MSRRTTKNKNKKRPCAIAPPVGSALSRGIVQVEAVLQVELCQVEVFLMLCPLWGSRDASCRIPCRFAEAGEQEQTSTEGGLGRPWPSDFLLNLKA